MMSLSSTDAQDVAFCPLCGLETKRTKFRLLNNFEVCRKCRDRFINRREMAYILDVILYYVIRWFGVFGLVRLFGREPEAITTLILWACFPFKDGFAGFSPGKWMCDLQVVDRNSLLPIGFAASFKRNLVTLIPYVGTIVVALQLGKGRRWGDGWANTMVIWRKHAHKAPFDPFGTCCENCGYDLTGNVSNVCPECGGQVSDRIRERIAGGSRPTGPINSESYES